MSRVAEAALILILVCKCSKSDIGSLRLGEKALLEAAIPKSDRDTSLGLLAISMCHWLLDKSVGKGGNECMNSTP